MEKQSHGEIIDELRQLCTQYLSEVPSRRRVWPKSIKQRVHELRRASVSCDQISQLTGIPVATLYGWKMPPENGFLPVKVVEKLTAAPIVEIPPNHKQKRGYKRTREHSTPTIIVIAPNGIRLEGLDLKSALTVAREMASWT
jgi:hypothetical protein